MLKELRNAVIEEAKKEGLAPIAASTHPFAKWSDQKYTAKERYDALNKNLQAAARRLLTCGMHVHCGIEDNELRMDFMRQASYILPHLLALSTSSPFWEGQNTGLKCYRLTVFAGMPRTGLPEYFASWGEYQRHVQGMVDTGQIEDETHIWWDQRASARYPTLETRIMDVCPLVEDAIALAALIQCIMHMLNHLRKKNVRWRIYNKMLIDQNRWRAIRYGTDEGLVDWGRAELRPFDILLDELIEIVMPDAEALDCVDEVQSARKILERGTSAHRQVTTYDKCIAAGKPEQVALACIVQQLVEETKKDCS